MSAEKAARGKSPTDVWWHTIVPTNGAEKTGYPTQKPEGLLRRFVAASSRPGDWCLDFFAGSGTLGAVSAQLGRRFVLVDDNPAAVAIATERLKPIGTLAPKVRDDHGDDGDEVELAIRASRIERERARSPTETGLHSPSW